MFNWWHTSIGGWHMERRPGSSSSFGRFSLLWSHLEGREDMIAADGNACIQLPAYIYSNKDSWLHTWNMYFLVFSVISQTMPDKIFYSVYAESVSHPLCAQSLRHWSEPSAQLDACWTGWRQRPSWVCCFQKWRHGEKQTVCNPAGPPVAASAQPFGPNNSPSRSHETDTHVQAWYRDYLGSRFV